MPEDSAEIYPFPHSEQGLGDAKWEQQSEEQVLGAALLSAEAIGEVFGTLTADDFYSPAHQDIYLAITSLYTEGKPVEPIAVYQHLPSTTRQRFSQADLFALANKVASPASISYYADRVQKAAAVRRVSSALLQGLSNVRKDRSASDIATEAIAGLTDALHGTQKTERLDAESVYTLAVERAAAQADGTLQENVLATGYRDLDSYLGGIREGNLFLVAGRPGTGKSIVALDIARHLAIHERIPVGFFSLEMSELEIGQRLVAAEAKVGLADLINARLSDKDWQKVAATREKIKNAPLWIDTRSNLTTGSIRASAQQMKAKHGLRLIIVDYLGLLRHPQEHRIESRQVMMSDISRELKLIAKDVVPVVALAQLNRTVESRHDKRPMLSDLRDTGALEQDSDVVLLLHRDDVNNPDSARAGEVDLFLAKHRNGPTAHITLANQYHYAQLQDL